MSRREGLHDQVSRRWSHPRAAEAWKLDAECAGEDPELWFPQSDGERASARHVKAITAVARNICAGCPVKIDCLAFAISLDLRYGIWGGLTERERAKLTGRRSG